MNKSPLLETGYADIAFGERTLLQRSLTRLNVLTF